MCIPRAGTPRSCTAVVTRAELDAPTSAVYEHVAAGRGWTQHKETYRQGGCGGGKADCPILQFANPHGNPDLPAIAYADLVPGGDAIVLSRIEWRAEVTDSDRLYKAGANLKLGHRMTYLVAYRDVGDNYGSVDDGAQIARYKLLSTPSTGSGKLDVVSTGMIVACAVPHPPGTNGSFIGCDHAHQLLSAASTYRVPFKAIVNARHCDQKDITAQRPDSIAAQCDAQRSAKINSLASRLQPTQRIGFVAAIRAAVGNESIDPYWFPCPYGCCTASTTLF